MLGKKENNMEYTWSDKEDIWNNSRFDTIEECYEDAENYIEDGGIIYIGEIEQWLPSISGEDILEDLEDRAYDDIGETASGMFDNISSNEMRDISDTLTECFKNWLKENNKHIYLYSVVNIKKYEYRRKS
jgi:hypothetical protein